MKLQAQLNKSWIFLTEDCNLSTLNCPWRESPPDLLWGMWGNKSLWSLIVPSQWSWVITSENSKLSLSICHWQVRLPFLFLFLFRSPNSVSWLFTFPFHFLDSESNVCPDSSWSSCHRVTNNILVRHSQLHLPVVAVTHGAVTNSTSLLPGQFRIPMGTTEKERSQERNQQQEGCGHLFVNRVLHPLIYSIRWLGFLLLPVFLCFVIMRVQEILISRCLLIIQFY